MSFQQGLSGLNAAARTLDVIVAREGASLLGVVEIAVAQHRLDQPLLRRDRPQIFPVVAVDDEDPSLLRLARRDRRRDTDEQQADEDPAQEYGHEDYTLPAARHLP